MINGNNPNNSVYEILSFTFSLNEYILFIGPNMQIEIISSLMAVSICSRTRKKELHIWNIL